MPNNEKNNIIEFDTLSSEERALAEKILAQLSTSGESCLYDDLLYADYKEKPVDIETFLTNDYYLGAAWKDKQGNSKLYPFWLKQLKILFPDNIRTSVNNFIESGARGLGKSEIAIATMCYLMHRIMCLRDANEHYHLKITEKICFAFMNITKTLSENIGISKFQHTIQMSPWFMQYGKMTKLNNEPYWVPPAPIEIIVGSQPSHVIGQPIFACLSGDTIIATDKGDYKISELENKQINVVQVRDNKLCISDTCTVVQTTESMEEYEIELEDGTIIKCTSNHRFMLKDGTYKEAKNLTIEDDLLDCSLYGYVYRTTNLVNGKIYIGQHRGKAIDKQYLGSGLLLNKSVAKYGKQNFFVELLGWAVNKQDLDLLERYYIRKYNSTDTSIGYNIAEGGQGGYQGQEVNKKISLALTGRKLSDELKQKLSIINKGKKLSQETKNKISISNKGKIVSAATRQRMSESFKKVDRSNWQPANKSKKAVTNGKTTVYIDKNSSTPDGFVYGNCFTSKPHNMTKYYLSQTSQYKNSVSKSGNKNSMWGNGHRVSGGLNGHATIRYFYDDKTFECRKDLVEYLNSQGYSISENAIRAIVNNTYKCRTAHKFHEVISNMRWEYKQ